VGLALTESVEAYSECFPIWPTQSWLRVFGFRILTVGEVSTLYRPRPEHEEDHPKHECSENALEKITPN
jgi:hypothetical protein